MAVLIKTGPLTRVPVEGSDYAFKEKAYRGPVFGAGEQAFIWVDGNGKGGSDSNLFAMGFVTEEPTFDDFNRSDSLVRVKVRLLAIKPHGPLNYISDIRPHRDDPANAVMHRLADVICKNAHRKVTVIGREEAALLASRFEK
jgi:hypothetical protein